MMKKVCCSLFLILFISNCFAQPVIGKWKTIDDITRKPKSIVEIYEKSGKIFGKIIEISDKSRVDDKCLKCEDDEKNKPLLGMVIIKNLVKDGDEYNSGTILDPKSGTVYKCKINLKGDKYLNIRGYVGISLLGRTQTWIRQ